MSFKYLEDYDVKIKGLPLKFMFFIIKRNIRKHIVNI